MRSSTRAALAAVLIASPVGIAHAGQRQAGWTDWGGGYLRGPDSASTTIATSGAGANKPAPIVIPTPPVQEPRTDWGGGYFRGPDSASTTIATSGAGTAKPNN